MATIEASPSGGKKLLIGTSMSAPDSVYTLTVEAQCNTAGRTVILSKSGVLEAASRSLTRSQRLRALFPPYEVIRETIGTNGAPPQVADEPDDLGFPG